MIEQNFKVDAIITDPPYNVSRKNNFKSIGRNGIDFGEWDKNFDQLKWLDSIEKITNDNCSIIIFNDWKNLGTISKKLEQKGFITKDIIRWVKKNPMPRNVERRYVTDFEFAIWATKGKWVFNKPINKSYLRPEYCHSVPMGSKRIHPTQKSGELIKEIILTHTNKGDIIFDPFSGSGEISLTAYNLGRSFVACEIDKKYYDLSKQRFKNNLTRPAFNHLGNKYRIMEELLSNFPTKGIDNFVDVFAGSGIVSCSYKYSKNVYMNEKDKNVYDILNFLCVEDITTLLKEIEKIIKKYDLPIEKSINYKTNYEKLKKDYNFNKNLDNRIAMLFTLILYGFNQQIRFNSKNEFNIPVGKFYWNNYQENKILVFCEKIKNKNIKVFNDDFEDFVNAMSEKLNNKKTIYYFDPPYLISQATYNSMWSFEDEDRLINLLERMIKKKRLWFLSNILVSKEKVNNKLLDFILKNAKHLKVYQVNTDYKNSNYQRKNNYQYKDLEIFVQGYKDD